MHTQQKEYKTAASMGVHVQLFICSFTEFSIKTLTYTDILTNDILLLLLFLTFWLKNS